MTLRFLNLSFIFSGRAAKAFSVLANKVFPPTGGIIFECNNVAEGGFFMKDQSECHVPPNGVAFSLALLFISAIFG